ncbi:RRM domain-containing protein [Abeliophyllum distichum]|uniref:RRM domain-containing protein n=1 Tax=Abeliophyllum distichum TaxID=126358 RepID=A0ABD1R8L6_9LAMI
MTPNVESPYGITRSSYGVEMMESAHEFCFLYFYRIVLEVGISYEFGRMLIRGSKDSSSMQEAGELHRKKMVEEREGEKEEDANAKDDPTAKAEAEVLKQNAA